MPSLPTPEEWVQIRHEYEHTRRSIEDICLANGFSPNTLRRRVKAWGWTMRQPPISDEGPPVRAVTAENADVEPPSHVTESRDSRPAHERLQGAAARVMRAIETTSARLATGAIHLRETEMAARALGSLTRTLRDLNALLGNQPMKAADDDPLPENMDEFRNELARRLEGVIASHEALIPAKYEAAWNEFAAESKQNVVL